MLLMYIQKGRLGKNVGATGTPGVEQSKSKKEQTGKHGDEFHGRLNPESKMVAATRGDFQEERVL
jgi:hypothetical protein